VPKADSPLGGVATGASLTSRGRRTRNALVQAAREVFEEDGFQDARIADIPARANVSYGSFYTYFDSKEAIFREVVSFATGEMFQASRSGVGDAGTPTERIHEATARYLSAYARNAGIMRVIEQVSPRDEYMRSLLLEIRSLFVQRIATGIRRLQDEGAADRALDADVAASALGGMVEHFARQWFIFGEQYDETVAVDTLTRLWARAIGLDPEAG
jgi:AcrR family transcriptional regulator